MNIIDRLSAAIAATKNPTVAGLDTQLSHLPQKFAEPYAKGRPWTPATASAAILSYNKALMQALSGVVPAVKVQVAYYEQLGVAGMQCFADTLQAAADMGFVTMADCKRNDIGATAEAYAAAYLGQTNLGGNSFRAFAADFVTVNGYLGVDGIAPFLKYCGERGIFVLAKTSNPSSGELQDLRLAGATEQTVFQHMGSLIAEWGKDSIGACGYSAVGAVVGATYPEIGVQMRKALPHTFFLLPGYGAQGATAEGLAGSFDKKGGGAVVNASRSILTAWKNKNTDDFTAAALEEALAMRGALQKALTL